MVYNPKIHSRCSIRLKEYDYSAEGFYFVTFCTQGRECLLGKIAGDKMILNQLGYTAKYWWKKLFDKFENINLDEFIIMPNHIHGIIKIVENSIVGTNLCVRPNPDYHIPGEHLGRGEHIGLPLRNISRNNQYQRRRMLIPKIIGYFKMNSSKRINDIRGLAGNSVWQRNYYENIIRDEQVYNEFYSYIKNNPRTWDSDRNNI